MGLLTNGLRQLPVRAPGDVWIDPGSRVRLEGTLQNGALVVADSLSAVDQLAPAAVAADATAAAPSIHRTAIVLFGFSGGPSYTSLSTTPAAAQALAFGSQPDSLASYYLEQTYGQLGFAGDVFGPFNVVDSVQSCSGIDLGRWAEQAEASAGINDQAYQHYIFVFPSRPSCPFAGIAEIGGHHVWINGDFSVRVLAHEIGHNLGLEHAGGLACSEGGAPAPMGDSCSGDGLEYLDPFDAMGSGDAGTGHVARPPDEHAAQAGPASAADLGREGHRRDRHLSHRAHGDADRLARAAAHPQVRRRELLRRVPPADRLVRQPGAARCERRPHTHGIPADREQSEPPERRHRADRHASRDPGRLDGRGHGPRPGLQRRVAWHHDQERQPGRHRRHARDRRAGRHAATERAQRPLRGCERHDGAAALVGGVRRLLGGRLRRQARRSPGRHACDDGLHRLRPRAGHDRRLHRGRRRRRGQRGAGRGRQPGDTRHGSAGRAAPG